MCAEPVAEAQWGRQLLCVREGGNMSVQYPAALQWVFWQPCSGGAHVSLSRFEVLDFCCTRCQAHPQRGHAQKVHGHSTLCTCHRVCQPPDGLSGGRLAVGAAWDASRHGAQCGTVVWRLNLGM